jgi:two-component system, chemotaxis family, chemotaxis protein CheV
MSLQNSQKGILLEAGTNEVEFLLLYLGSQRYGINVSKVCQILVLDMSVIAKVPNQLPQLIGVMPFRDRTISVVDLKEHINAHLEDPTPTRRLLLVTEFNKRTTGFVIDAVDHIERCSWKQFEPITETSCNATNGCVVGTIRLPDGIVIILDVETVLTSLDSTMNFTNFSDQIKISDKPRADKHILYCEDSLLIQKTLVKTLNDAGFRNFHTFSSGAPALQFLRENPDQQIDIILSDIEMPQMDGLSFCKQVKEIENRNKTPFIFFSSMINEQMKSKCIAVGGNAAFSKPEIHLIVQELDNLLWPESKKK